MNIFINNQEKETLAGNIALLAEELQLPERGVAVAVNNRIVPRTEWQAATLCENDHVTIIKAAFGG